MMWQALKKNLPIKVTSLILAILLWGMVAGQQPSTRQLSVPLVLPELPDSLMHLRPIPNSVEVTFSATGRRLFWFRIQPPRMAPSVLLMSTSEPDTIWLDKGYLDLPRAFHDEGKVERVHPPFVLIHLGEVLEKQVQVKAVLGREPRHPYRLDEAEGLVVEPSRVTVRGPRRRVSQMPWVRTEFLDLQEDTQSGEKELGLESEDPLISFSPEQVKVRYKISRWDEGS